MAGGQRRDGHISFDPERHISESHNKNTKLQTILCIHKCRLSLYVPGTQRIYNICTSIKTLVCVSAAADVHNLFLVLFSVFMNSKVILSHNLKPQNNFFLLDLEKQMSKFFKIMVLFVQCSIVYCNTSLTLP